MLFSYTSSLFSLFIMLTTLVKTNVYTKSGRYEKKDKREKQYPLAWKWRKIKRRKENWI